MSRATDNRLCIPPVAAAAGRRPISLIRAQRIRELFLCWHLAMCLRLEWRARLDPIGTFELAFDLGGSALTKSERADLAEALHQELAEPEPVETTAMLDAAGRWFCRLRLPTDEDELLAGPPLRARVTGIHLGSSPSPKRRPG